jgi:hypothetical protein
MNKDRAHILDELERFHLGKLNEIRVKRGVSTLDRPRQVVIDGTINLKLDARERRLVVTWDE